MRNTNRLALLLVLAMLVSLLAACGGAAEAPASASAPETAASDDQGAAAEDQPAEPAAQPEAEDASSLEASAVEDGEAEEPVDYPWGIVRNHTEAEPLPLVDEPTTLTAWDYCVPPVFEVIHDYGTDGQVYRELQERTGVTLQFTTANLLQASSDMALMIAANELPDIIFNFGMFNSYNADDLVEGDLIVNYCDYEDVMPNYFDILNNNPNITRDIMTEDGNIIYAANISSDLTPNSGPATAPWPAPTASATTPAAAAWAAGSGARRRVCSTACPWTASGTMCSS